MTDPACRPLAHILGIGVDALDMEGALSRVAGLLREGGKGYVCAASVHGIMEAQRSADFAAIYSQAAMIVPDGMPLVWVGRMQGYEVMRRVTGPDLMLEMFRRKEFATVTHFLYGGRGGVADDLRDRMKARFPWAQIVGTWTPPFRALTAEEETQLVDRMRVLKPDIFWVGISCPKQEQFMFRYLPLLQTKLMFGVGAAFDYHTGRIRDCSPWVKRAGLQWLHRLGQDPRRLWRRYLRNNSAFLWRLALQAAGLRRYPDACVSPMRVVSERHTSEVHSS